MNGKTSVFMEQKTTSRCLLEFSSSSQAKVPNHSASRSSFIEDNFSMDQGCRVQGWGGFQMIQALYIHFSLYFYYYYTSPTSDHKALDSRGWGPLLWTDE